MQQKDKNQEIDNLEGEIERVDPQLAHSNSFSLVS